MNSTNRQQLERFRQVCGGKCGQPPPSSVQPVRLRCYIDTTYPDEQMTEIPRYDEQLNNLGLNKSGRKDPYHPDPQGVDEYPQYEYVDEPSDNIEYQPYESPDNPYYPPDTNRSIAKSPIEYQPYPQTDDLLDSDGRYNPYYTEKPLKEQFPFQTMGKGSSFLGSNVPPPDTSIPPDTAPNPPDDPTPGPPPPPPPPPPASCPNYHPDHSIPGKMSQADTVRAITAYVNSKGYRHDPDGIPWLSPGSWVPWDGVTTYNPCTLTKSQLLAGIFPPPGGVNTMRGLRELFYQINPFADNQNPTVAEIERWNVEVIRHFRRLLGFNESTHPVSNDKCTYLKAAWAEERLRTNYWSGSYPGTQDGAAGPCTQPLSSNAHCGGGFVLNPTDQTPYLCPADMAPCGGTTGAEGLANHNTDIPWGIRMSRIIGTYLAQDGIGGHTGPFVGRPLFGSAWNINPSNPASLTVRTKWNGPLVPTCP